MHCSMIRLRKGPLMPRFISFLFCLLVVQGSLRAAQPLLASAEDLRATHSALILYDGPATEGDSFITALEIANLMPHFGYRGDVQPVGNYTAGMADKYDAVIVYGLAKNQSLPAGMLNDISRFDRPVCWIYQSLDQLVALPGVTERLGFEQLGEDSECPIVSYHGVDIPNSQPDLHTIKILDPKKAQVLVTAHSDDDSSPYVVRSGQFWYFASPIYLFAVDQSVVFMDLLHDILGVHHERQKLAMVRIEDVSASTNPEDLRRTTDLLTAHNVPFQIALIPVFKDPANQIEMQIFDQSEVVDALHNMVSRGGTVVMHGITHQLHGVSGDDFEFWDPLTNRPSADGAPATLYPKLQRGLDECFRAGLYPVAFETPHYAASMEHYQSLAKVFSHCYERRMVSQTLTQQIFPFETRDMAGQFIVPENLGYVPLEDPEADTIINEAHVMTVMRDPISSFFFHPFMPAKLLDRILTAMQNDGYRFISIKDFSPQLALHDSAVSTVARQLELTPLQPVLKTVTVDSKGLTTEKYQTIDPGKLATIKLDPPEGGLVAVQTVPQAPAPPPKEGFFARVNKRLWGNGQELKAAVAGRTRQALIVGGVAPGFQSALGVYGIPCHAYNPDAPVPIDAFVIVPHQCKMDQATQEHLAAMVTAGGCVLLEGPSPFAERIGFKAGLETVTTDELQDLLMPDVPINCAVPLTFRGFTSSPVSSPLVLDKAGEQPVAVCARIGEGTAIYLGAELDLETNLGYTRYPFLYQHLHQRFGTESPVTSDGIEYYFDPGLRDAAPIEKLVLSWKREGVRAVYAAAWHFWPKWTFDYARFIRLCHQQGIAVYAWIELPEVSPKFWEEHPEWREQTVTGRDAEIGWRQFMNLSNDECRAAAFQFVDKLLSKYDWDGVNIAELCFDTKGGLGEPDGYIPMNKLVRDEFNEKAGFDPIQLFDEQSPNFWKTNQDARTRWNDYRSGLTRDWLAELLEKLKKRDLDVIVTALDSFSDPSVLEKNGCNSVHVVDLMSRFKFTLQVEDSAANWGDSPDRYTKFGETYRKLVPDPSRLMFDINVVQDRPSGKAPTALCSGVELALTARAAASAGNGRVGIYSEATVLEEDRALLPFVMGSTAIATRQDKSFTITSEQPAHFQYAIQSEKKGWWSGLWHGSSYEPWPIPLLNHSLWPCGTKGRALLGKGNNVLTLPEAPPKNDTMWVKDITAPFDRLELTDMGVAIDYTARCRVWAEISHEPSAVLVDGHSLPTAATRLSDFEWMVEMPAGKHRVEIQEATTASLAIRMAGEKTSSSIVWVATRALLLLLVFYSSVLARRLWNRIACASTVTSKNMSHV